MKNITFSLILICFTVLIGCKKESSNSDNKVGRAYVEVLLTDTPGLYDAVYIEILKVDIHTDNSGWTTLSSINSGIYNLLDFTNGIDTLIGSASIPTGTVSQIRFYLGMNNSVVIDGTTHMLDVPSGSQSGLKVNLHQQLNNGISYKIWLDFDAGRSIVEKGNGTYSLKPVVRAYSDAISGAIKGISFPDSATAHVMAITGTDTSGTIPDSLGNFLIGGLSAGTYNVVFTNMNGYKDTTISPVNVSVGAITDMGVIQMQ